MNELCFMSGLTSEQWAAWVQAVFSVVAIVAAAGVAFWQSRHQHKSALTLYRTERRDARLDLAKSIQVVAALAAAAMKYITDALKDREAVYLIAEGHRALDVAQLGTIATYLSAVPLHELPHSLVGPTMVLGGTVRQCKEKIELVMRVHESMNSDAFEDFFNTLAEMNSSAAETCKDIDKEVKRLGTI